MERLLHKFGVGKEGTAEREELTAKVNVATSAPLLCYSSAPSPHCRSQQEVTMGTMGISWLGSNKQAGKQQVQKADL